MTASATVNDYLRLVSVREAGPDDTYHAPAVCECRRVFKPIDANDKVCPTCKEDR